MKKVTLVLSGLLSLSLTACSTNQQTDNSSYNGEIVFSQFEGQNLKLTVRNNNCKQQQEGSAENIVVSQAYDSDLPVGACVKVSKDENGNTVVDNISRSPSRSWLSRTVIH